MAKIYFDTGALVKLYIVEPGSTFVQNKARRAEVIPINPLQETELRNAILAAGGRRSIARNAMRRSLDNFDEDLATGVFTRETPEWPWIYRRADLLARQYTPRFLCRTLDILHVAAAELCGADQIVTGDQRQQKLAKAIGMAVVKVPAAGRLTHPATQNWDYHNRARGAAAAVTSDERQVVSGQECGEQKKQPVHVPSLYGLPRRTPALNDDFSFILN